ncbi:hypothetical protein D9613_001047 [Agrocybe pediades]|uniref:Uncharacterized protein n=1 Tax=Agrocybe pediades TaxID=84607 RepID=A0A8H4VT29_9AGAR|nr:hypothetical protein D9613_001047 [Agrocybe pediades]
MGDSIAGMDVFVDDTDQRIVYGGGAWKSVKNIDITSPPKDSLASNPLFGTFHTFNATASATGQPAPSFTLAFNFTGIQFKAMFHMSSTLGIKSCSVDNNKQTISSRDSLNEKVSCNNGGKPLSPGPHSLVITFDPDPATPIQFDGIIYTPNDPSKPVPDSNIITYFNTANPDISHLGFGGMSNVDMMAFQWAFMSISKFKYSTDSVDPAQLSYTVDGSQDPVHFTVTNPCNKKNSTISSQLLIQTPLSSRNQSIFHLTYYNASEPSAVNQTKFTVRFMVVQNATTPNVQLPVFPTLTSSISSSISATSLTTPLPRTIHANRHRIAIVVGFSLAIIALITACLLFYLWRRRNAKAAKEQLDNNSIWPRPYYPKRNQSVRPSKIRHENTTHPERPVETSNRPTRRAVEAASADSRRILYRMHEDGGEMAGEYESGSQTQVQVEIVDVPPSYENIQDRRTS